MPISLLSNVLTDARKKRDSVGQLNEALYRFHYDEQQVRVDRPKQDASKTHVRTTGDGGADVILEIHSHGSMRAFWSSTDNADEKGFRFYGVIGRLETNPQIPMRRITRIPSPYPRRSSVFRSQSITIYQPIKEKEPNEQTKTYPRA